MKEEVEKLSCRFARFNLIFLGLDKAVKKKSWDKHKKDSPERIIDWKEKLKEEGLLTLKRTISEDDKIIYDDN